VGEEVGLGARIQESKNPRVQGRYKEIKLKEYKVLRLYFFDSFNLPWNLEFLVSSDLFPCITNSTPLPLPSNAETKKIHHRS